MVTTGISTLTGVSSIQDVGGIEPEVSTWSVISGISDSTYITDVDNLVKDLKYYGFWSRVKALHVLLGGTEAKNKFNVKDARDLDAAFRLTFTTGWTHASSGVTGDGAASTYISTFFIPSTEWADGLCSFGCYSGTNITGSGQNFLGCVSNIGTRFVQLTTGTGSFFASQCSNSQDNVADTDSRGWYWGARTEAGVGVHHMQKNLNLVSQQTGDTLGIPIVQITYGARNYAGVPDQQTTRELRLGLLMGYTSKNEGLMIAILVNKFMTARSLNTF